jgi:hypothetical protein
LLQERAVNVAGNLLLQCDEVQHLHSLFLDRGLFLVLLRLFAAGAATRNSTIGITLQGLYTGLMAIKETDPAVSARDTMCPSWIRAALEDGDWESALAAYAHHAAESVCMNTNLFFMQNWW